MNCGNHDKEECGRQVCEKRLHIDMCPGYQNYARNEIYDNILSGSILGSSDGIATTEDRQIKY